jgi:hypothetical protein
MIYQALQSKTDTRVLGTLRLPMNIFSKDLSEMESPGKYKEDEINRDLLTSTV